MSKWADEFVEQYRTVGTLKRITDEVKEARKGKEMQEDLDATISKVLKGHFKRKGK
tara:strand:+ start:1542 stop:1709 length:168 start_codon:yes stop_codon:yes gene_type:complete